MEQKKQKLREIINTACPELQVETASGLRMFVNPTLEHLLRAIPKAFLLDRNGMFYHVSTIVPMNLVGAYNLTKSPLEQSEEVTDFIYNLICE